MTDSKIKSNSLKVVKKLNSGKMAKKTNSLKVKKPKPKL